MLNNQILLDSLNELASEELQWKLWVHGNDNLMSSFTEAVCGVFDDSGLDRAKKTGYLANNFPVEICVLVDRLYKLIRKVPDNLKPEETINHPEMQSIRLVSYELLNFF